MIIYGSLLFYQGVFNPANQNSHLIRLAACFQSSYLFVYALYCVTGLPRWLYGEALEALQSFTLQTGD